MTAADAPAAEQRVTAGDVSALAQLACLLEVSAAKPGNVSPGRPFADMRYEDFLVSALAIGEPLAGAGDRPLGATIRLAIEETRRWTRANTNLGIVLLLTPLVKGVWPHLKRTPATGSFQVSPLNDPRSHLRRVLGATDVQDARDVYAAIRLASPGGLGRAGTQDVASEPTVTLLEAMRLAAHRDGIAREYATAFETTFEIGVPALEDARREGLSWDDAVVETFLTLLAAAPDTHVARRSGEETARAVSAYAQRALAAGGVRSENGRREIAEMDRSLRDSRNSGNPGTAADLTTAAIFLVLLRERLSGSTAMGGGHAPSR